MATFASRPTPARAGRLRKQAAAAPRDPAFGRLTREELRRIVAERIG